MLKRPRQPHTVTGITTKYLVGPDAESLKKIIRDHYPEWIVADGVSQIRGNHGEANAVACTIYKYPKAKQGKSNFSFGDDSGTESGGGVKKYRAKKKFKDKDDER